MSEDRKKPGVTFWTTVALVAVLFYSASFGPACWLASRAGIGKETLPAFYRPILLLMKIDDSPADLRKRLTPGPLSAGSPVTLYFYPSGVVNRYASWLAAENWNWRFFQAFEYQPDPILRVTEGNWEWCDATKS